MSNSQPEKKPQDVMGSAIPDLPVLVEDDSMLSRKFGREVANYFSGSPLNRVSFLRTDYGFLRAAFAHHDASFLLLNNLSPLTKDAANLAYVSRDVVVPLTGEEPFKNSEEEQLKDFNSAITQPIVLFLGIDEKKTGLQYRDYNGKPYFAVDITPKGTIAEKATSIVDIVKASGVSFLDGRRLMSLNAPEAAIYAEARALLDWNSRNPFCGGCGQPTTSINAGWKRVCPPRDLAGVPEGGEPKERADCPTRHGISNLCFPRTDPTVIMAIVSADGNKLLLGRNKRFPPNWYSTLAGFLEPGESIEEAVRRETWEESGVTVGRVVIHSSQPWPYPANLMIGAIGQAAPGGETIHLGHDEELTDAKWYTLDEVTEGIAKGVSGLGEPAPEGYKEGGLRLPPQTAIANQLIQAVLKGYLDVVPKI
ncbi:NUDIX hydrolase domain-like protein [Hypoxylon trugodes]|uniref:NUDIX hydrolase domain-like protein n=1 Tax=Hypoxylon trugodes TaxID=326681 RepID=UPI00218FE60C|nr:NUDIX hydrolase domain-like protein [Hypoxylon trugodes]KAI1393798.1 NUDIX hydrolase domain-like protein [Hypoxylon trugodes]